MIQIIKETIDYIENNIEKNMTIDEIANKVHTSVRSLQRGFTMVTEINISEYIQKRKMDLISKEILNTGKKIYEIGSQFGYENPESFTRAFKNIVKCTPSEYREKGLKSFEFKRIITDNIFDYKKYELLYCDAFKEDERPLIGIFFKEVHPNTEELKKNKSTLIDKINFDKLKDKYTEIYYSTKDNSIVKYGIYFSNELNLNTNQPLKRVEKILIPSQKWVIAHGRSLVSYEEAKSLTMLYLNFKGFDEMYNDYGYYHDIDFSDQNKITNLCENCGMDEDGYYNCVVKIPVKEDYFVDKKCETCEFCMGGVCAGRTEDYGKSINELIERFPKGCEEYRISYEAFCVNEDIRKEKAKEIFAERYIYKLLNF